jgi:hypothetical protein
MRLLRSPLSYLSAALLLPLQHPSWKPGEKKEWYPIPLPQLKLDLLLLLKQLWLLVRKAAREYPKYYNYQQHVLSLTIILPLKTSSLSLLSS